MNVRERAMKREREKEGVNGRERAKKRERESGCEWERERKCV